MRHILTIFFCFSLSTSFAQEVILFENFEGALTGWTKSITEGVPDNEWFLLPYNSPFTAGGLSLGVDTGAGTNTYNNETSDHSVWVKPNWPAVATDKEIVIQFDGYSDGELVGNFDLLTIYLADIPDGVLATDANLDASNSMAIGYLYDIDTWGRFAITLNASQLNFIQNAINGATLSFNWINDNDGNLDQPPGNIDNVLITWQYSSKPPLAGDYSIGLKNGEQFPTLTSAINYLNNYGQSNDVNFYLSDELYNKDFETFPIILGDGSTTPYTGMGTYNLTIKPDPGTGATPTIVGTNFFVPNVGTVTFRGVSNITIDGANTIGGVSQDLSIISNNNADDFVMPLFIAGENETDVVQDITIRNTNFSTNSQDKGYGLVAGLFSAETTNTHFESEALFNNITIDNNHFESVLEAIHIDGVDRSLTGFNAGSLASNITITGNNLVSPNTTDWIREYGIHLLGVDVGEVSNNQIGDFDQTDLNADAGLVIDKNCKNLNVFKNEIFNMGFDGNTTSNLSAHAINLYSGLSNCNISISNNVIRGISGNGASSTANAGFLNPVAIFVGLGGEAGLLQLYNQSGISIYNNSIYMSGNEMDFTTSVSMGIAVAANSTDVNFQNNIIKNDLGGDNSLAGKASALAIFIENDGSQLTTLNYNGYHVDAEESHTNNYIGLVGSLADLLTNANTQMYNWRLATGKELRSIHANPGFTSATYLKPDNTNANSWNVSGMGVHLAGIVDDIEGVLRPVDATEGAPDIGAYEFDTDLVASTPISIVINGPFVAGVEYVINVNELERASITFDGSSDIPTSITFTYYSGHWPEDPLTYNIANNYFDVEFNGQPEDVYLFDIDAKYDDPGLGTLLLTDPDVHLALDDTGNGEYKALNTAVSIADKSFDATGVRKGGRYVMTSGSTPLPIVLYSFTGEAKDNYNNLRWETLVEVNNDKFLIEKSTNGQDWVKWRTVDGAGDSKVNRTYELNDFAYAAKQYYRLNQIDFDGTLTVLETVMVVNYKQEEVFIYPNPVKHKCYVTTNNGLEGVEYKLYSLNNELVKSGRIGEDSSIDMYSVAKGIYILEVGIVKMKVIKE